MKKIIKWTGIIILILIFFFAPVVYAREFLMTKAQKEALIEFCNTHGCGTIMPVTPYEYIKESFLNLVIRK